MEIERSIDHIILQHHELLAMVKSTFPNYMHIQEWEILKGGAQNTNYKFKIANGEFVLRIYARDRSHCKTEKELQLIDGTVLTAKLIYADESNESWAYSIFQFIHRDQFPLELEALKQGYLQNGGILPTEWLKSAMITDFVNIATMMDTPAERPKLFKELKQVLKLQ
jgi:hypothetical protein